MKELLREMVEREMFLVNYRKLNEVAFHRIFDKYHEMGFIAISANRSCEAEMGVEECEPEQKLAQEKQNKKNFIQLKKDVRQAGYGFIPVRGGYQEKGEDGTLIQVEEPSLVIPDLKNDPDAIHELGMRLSQKYNQDSFLWKPPASQDKDAYFITQNGEVEMTFDDVAVNDLEQMFYSYIAKGNSKTKRWSMTESRKPIFFIPRPPGNIHSAAARQGEYFFLAESGMPFRLGRTKKK